MKRVLLVVLCISLLVGATACSGGVSQDEYNALLAERDSLQSQVDGLTNSLQGLPSQEEYDSLKSENDELKGNISELEGKIQEAASQPTEAPLQESQQTPATVDAGSASSSGEVLVEQDGVKITSQGISTDDRYVSADVLIENNSDIAIMVQTRDASVNGIMVDPYFSETVAGGKKSNGHIKFRISDLAEEGIGQVAEIEFYFTVVEDSNWHNIFDSETVIIK